MHLSWARRIQYETSRVISLRTILTLSNFRPALPNGTIPSSRPTKICLHRTCHSVHSQQDSPGLGRFLIAFEYEIKTKFGTCHPQHMRMSLRMELTYGRMWQKSTNIFKSTLREILVSVVLYYSVNGWYLYSHKKGKHKVKLYIFFTLDTTLCYDMIYMMLYDIIWYMIWFDMIWCMIWCVIWYYMIRYDMIWYDVIYDMIYLLTTIGLTPGGSSTVNSNTQTIHRTTQWNRIYRTEHI